MYSFPNFEPVHCSISSFNCCFLSCIQISQEAGQVVWYSHLLKNFPQFIVIHTVKGLGIVNKAEIDFFWNSLALSMIQWMLAIWSLVPLPFHQSPALILVDSASLWPLSSLTVSSFSLLLAGVQLRGCLGLVGGWGKSLRALEGVVLWPWRLAELQRETISYLSRHWVGQGGFPQLPSAPGVGNP